MLIRPHHENLTAVLKRTRGTENMRVTSNGFGIRVVLRPAKGRSGVDDDRSGIFPFDLGLRTWSRDHEVAVLDVGIVNDSRGPTRNVKCRLRERSLEVGRCAFLAEHDGSQIRSPAFSAAVMAVSSSAYAAAELASCGSGKGRVARDA